MDAYAGSVPCRVPVQSGRGFSFTLAAGQERSLYVKRAGGQFTLGVHNLRNRLWQSRKQTQDRIPVINRKGNLRKVVYNYLVCGKSVKNTPPVSERVQNNTNRSCAVPQQDCRRGRKCQFCVLFCGYLRNERLHFVVAPHNHNSPPVCYCLCYLETRVPRWTSSMD